VQNYQTFYGIQILNSFRANTSYDSVYLVALALAQGQANTRQTVLNNLRSVSGGTGVAMNAVKINNGDISQALQIIANGGSIDYEGATGPINFDQNGDISVFGYIKRRIVQDQGGNLSVVNEGEPQVVGP